MRIVDIDDARTWTQAVRNATDSLADGLRGTTTHTTDLEISPEEEDQFRSNLRGVHVKAYHATRLLDHEAENIRRDGLAPASHELVETRIESAFDKGYISDSERDELLARNLFAAGARVDNREGWVCLFGTRHVMSDEVHGIWRLLTTWGGEIIYFGSGMSDGAKARLKAMGRPAIVVAGIELWESWRVHHVWPGIANSFVGKRLGFDEYGFDLFHRGEVGPQRILAIWMPGDAEYDRFSQLPLT